MEELMKKLEALKKKFESMPAQNALYIYAGLAVVMLVLFLSGGVVGVSKETLNGMDILFGIKIQREFATVGTGAIFGWIALLSLIGVTGWSCYKKRLNWILSLIPTVAFLITSFTCKYAWFTLRPRPLMWLIILLAIVWTGVAFLRGNHPAKWGK